MTLAEELNGVPGTPFVWEPTGDDSAMLFTRRTSVNASIHLSGIISFRVGIRSLPGVWACSVLDVNHVTRILKRVLPALERAGLEYELAAAEDSAKRRGE